MTVKSIIKELQQMAQAGLPTKELLRECLTLRARVSFQEALLALSKYELTILYCLQGAYSPHDAAEQTVCLAFRPHGRFYLMPADVYDRFARELILVRRVSVPLHVHCDAEMELQAYRTMLECSREQIFNALGVDNLTQKATAISEAALHMAPLIFNVGSLCVSNFYHIGGDGFEYEMTLVDAMKVVCEQGVLAPIELLVLVYCLHCLFASGSYTRPEEFNSCQINPQALRVHFIKKYKEYEAVLNTPEASLNDFMVSSLEQQAACLKAMRSAMMEQGRFVREINGLNLLKKERFIRHWLLSDEVRRITLSAQSHALIEQALGREISAAEFFSPNVIPSLISHRQLRKGSDRFSSDLEFLIDALLRKVVEVTHSDIAMTRGTRCFARFVELLQSGDGKALSEWSQAEYFCHAVPSQAMLASHSLKSVATALNAVSARMRFNTWHYAPSYVQPDSVPANRSWFHAPRMADTTEWSDYHHAGHVHAAVRYCIRSPQSIQLRDHSLPGFTDLRLMRQNGMPYSPIDLGTAIAYTEALGLVYQRLMDYVLATQHDFTFRFGDKTWFENNYQEEPGAVVGQAWLS